jgi:hypothetical protein
VFVCQYGALPSQEQHHNAHQNDSSSMNLQPGPNSWNRSSSRQCLLKLPAGSLSLLKPVVSLATQQNVELARENCLLILCCYPSLWLRQVTKITYGMAAQVPLLITLIYV